MDDDLTAHADGITGDSGDQIICPVPCAWCDELGAGGCEDCLDCLLWPELPPPRVRFFPELPGPTSRLPTDDLQRRRAQLGIGDRIGLVSRRHRRVRQLSQRDLAADLGWSQPSINRAERRGGSLSVDKVETLLRHAGFRLAIVRDDTDVGDAAGEDLDTAWGTPDLVARDGAGRRLPPFGLITWRDEIDRRLDAGGRGHETEWTWRRSG